VWRKPI